MIQLSIREHKPIPCRSWNEAHEQILNSFDKDGHTSFSLLDDDGYEWAEEGIHWRMFDAVAESPDALRCYFKMVGRA